MQQNKNQKQSLRIVFVTDIHLSNQYLSKLQQWNKNHLFKFDFCLCGGDISNCDQNNKTHNEKQMQQAANQVLIKLKQIFKCKVLYIPGNHDPLSYFDNQLQIQSQIENIHNKQIQLANGLKLVGYGGSVPGYLDSNCTMQRWKGYPFQSNQQLDKQLQKNNVFKQAFEKQYQVIVLTHTGPFKSSTSISKRQQNIYAGATAFDYLLKNQNLILYLHGHTHDGSKFQKLYQKPIINPGPLLYGQFSHFYFQFQNKKWKLLQTDFIHL